MRGRWRGAESLLSSIDLARHVPHCMQPFRRGYAGVIILLLILFSVTPAMAAESADPGSTSAPATAAALVSPWATQDVGLVGVAGSAEDSGDTFSVKGSGEDIWGTADSFRYFFRELTGDGQITARVAWVQNTHESAKAGVMIRETLAADSKNVIMELTPANGVIFQRRDLTGGPSSWVSGPFLSAPYWVRLVRSGNLFWAYVSADGQSWELVAAQTIQMASTVRIGLAVTSHDNTRLCTGWFDGVQLTGSGLSARWSTADVGQVGVAGSVATGTYTVKGSGEDIWGTADGFRFVYQQLAGDGQITARVAALENTHESAKAGIMIRETLTAGSRNAVMEITPGNGAIFQRRHDPDAPSVYTPGPHVPVPYWVRLVRSGKTVTAYASTDGYEWIMVGADTVDMGSTVYVGLAVASHDNSRLCTAQFDNVELTGWNRRTVITATDLGHLGGNWSEAVAVNEAGIVAGNSRIASGDIHAFVWNNGVMTDLGAQGTSSKAVAINSSGDVVGNNQTAAGSRGFIWRNGVMTDLGTLGGATTEVADMNDAGEVVGKSTTASGANHGFRWKDGVMTDLGTLGGTTSYAVDINSVGQIVGTSEIAPYGWRGFLWSNGSLIDLGPFPYPIDINLNTFATKINETGTIVGYGNYFPSGHYTHPFLWKNGLMTDIGADAFFGDHGHAADINHLEQVVGSFTIHAPPAAGFLWQDGRLEPVGPYDNSAFSHALRINDNGEVIGYNFLLVGSSSTVHHAFTWKGGKLTYLPTPFGEVSDAAAISNAGRIAGTNAGRAVLWSREVVPNAPDSIGTFRGGAWYLDRNGNRAWDAGDSAFSFGNPGDAPVSGRWDGGNAAKVGVFRGGAWYLDLNGNGAWDAGVDLVRSFGIASDIPVVGDWTGNGTTNIGVFRNGQWFLDLDGSGTWGSTDAIYSSGGSTYTFGIPGDIPVTGDWNGSGTTKIGVVRGNTWFLDMNGNGSWDEGIDASYSFGIPGDTPVTGDWTGTGITRIGVVRGGSIWYLDINGNGAWDDGADAVVSGFGILGDLPVTGNW